MFKALALASAAIAGSAAAAPPDSPYHVTDRWALGGDGGWDYLTVDAKRHLLYLSRATRVAVVDTTTGKLSGDIEGTSGVHGIAIAEDAGSGFITAGKADEVKVFDLGTRTITGSIAVGKKPDAILYDPTSRRVFVFNGHGNSISVIDPAAKVVVKTIGLDGNPEYARSDAMGHVYVNIEDKNSLVQIDVASLEVTAEWPLPGCDGPTGLALDALHHRSISVCSNAAATILDTTTGSAVATLPIGHGVDGAEFDAESQNAFSANGDGTLTVIHESDPAHFAVIQTLDTGRGARTIALDGSTHRLYLPTAKLGTAEPTAFDAHPKPPILPDSFFVLVVAASIKP